MAGSESKTCDGDPCDKRKNKGRFCVAGLPNNVSCKNTSYTDNISMHNFPKDSKLKHEWEKFVRKNRPDSRARGDNISLCSDHFKKECYDGPKLVSKDTSGHSFLKHETRISYHIACKKDQMRESRV
ncbi:predicted protein [Nematostella vectensis]|uniref:THAP-type domain-containing protein n=1 Tax=Nematostella vectensis TaxID=45351 RepID=A7SSY2_NEMVE|nr:predicted protein [Nematostella vectensis]|eukprot:XP_001625289.1 predicted protein [Nematostella vectensis]